MTDTPMYNVASAVFCRSLAIVRSLQLPGCDSIESTVKLTKVTQKVIWALNFKQQVDSLSFRLVLSKLKIVVQSKTYSNTSKVMRFGKVYFDPITYFIGALWLHL